MKETKAYSADLEGFTETEEFRVLCCGNVEGNNNKFYCMELQKNPSSGEYRVFIHRGRINTSNVYGVYGPSSFGAVRSKFAEILKKKLKGKTKKDKDGTKRREQYEIVKTVSPKVGSYNIRDKAIDSTDVSVKESAIIQEASRFSSHIQGLIRLFAKENIHRITGVTSITLTDNGFETPLGPVTTEQIENARDALKTIQGYVKSGNGQASPDASEVRTANNLYYSLIPHSFGRQIQQTDWILNDTKLIEEFDLLDQLAAAVEIGLGKDDDVVDQFAGLELDIEDEDQEIANKIADRTHKAKQSMHHDAYGWNVSNVFKIHIHKERERFKKKGEQFGNVETLFHGSKNCNLLSILMGGLIIPPHNAGHVTGRMFGDGIYAASSSTKALNYSTGWWHRGGDRSNSVFLLLVDFAMGKMYEADRSMYNGPPVGYNSVYAKGGADLVNDEYIVYSLPQCTVTHLIELKK